mmetsp:Transcript_11339/g.30547  ORF Transcript_11339/g.30547 Transcript_11339/m.30547 type:complete len:152 (+) Transcript_11339:319-774(+)
MSRGVRRQLAASERQGSETCWRSAAHVEQTVATGNWPGSWRLSLWIRADDAGGDGGRAIVRRGLANVRGGAEYAVHVDCADAAGATQPAAAEEHGPVRYEDAAHVALAVVVAVSAEDVGGVGVRKHSARWWRAATREVNVEQREQVLLGRL